MLLAALSMIAVSAHAAPKLSAKSVTAGGMPGPNPGMCMASELSVYADGKVITTKCGKSPVLAMTLSAKIVGRLATIAATADQNGGKIEQDKPNAPMCMDAPDTTVSLISPKGPIAIGGIVGCNATSLHWEDRVFHFETRALETINQLVHVAYSADY